jgi:hypothetical protein
MVSRPDHAPARRPGSPCRQVDDARGGPGAELRPEATKAALKNAQDWLLSHARQLMAYTALILGAYLAISGLVRLA